MNGCSIAYLRMGRRSSGRISILLATAVILCGTESRCRRVSSAIIIFGVGAVRKSVLATGAALFTLGSALAWQMPWREYPGQDNIAPPLIIRRKPSGFSRA